MCFIRMSFRAKRETFSFNVLLLFRGFLPSVEMTKKLDFWYTLSQHNIIS